MAGIFGYVPNNTLGALYLTPQTGNEAIWRQALANQGSISKTRPSLGGRLENLTVDTLRKAGVSDRTAARLGSKTFSAVNDLTPVGNLTGADEGASQFGRGLTRGDLGQAALGAGIFGLSVFPGAAGRVVGKVGKGMFGRLMRDESGAIRARHGSPHDFDNLRGVDLASTASVNSAVANGPVKAFHGTAWPEFDRFDPNMIGENYGGFASDIGGFHFTSSEDRARQYADFDAIGMPQDGGRVITANLNVTNPLTIPMAGGQNDLIAALDRNPEWLRRAAQGKHDALEVRSTNGGGSTYVVFDPSLIDILK